MRYSFAMTVLAMAMAVSAMGSSGGREAPPSRVNPPSPAEVDAAQTAPATPAPAEQLARTDLRIMSAGEVTPEQFLWNARPVVVFADTDADPAFSFQIKELQGGAALLNERDVVVITDTDPTANSIWRQRLHPRGFSLVILGKDGQVKQRKPSPWSAREIARAIDKFPQRREEIGRAGLFP
ncbi:MAG: DUF4174 domain-containing protein [Paracoccus sp. (in: a-proteobacteria)]